MTQRRQSRILVVFLGIVLGGIGSACGLRLAEPPIVGQWRGNMTSGAATVPCVWRFTPDGKVTATLALPQGTVAAQGVYRYHDKTLVQRTTSRTINSLGTQKTITLVNPIEAVYDCQLSGDTLTLTRGTAQEKIVLTREKE